MDARFFAAGPMGLKDDLLTMPLEARFACDPGRNMFFLNMEGMPLVSEGEVQAIGTEAGNRLAVTGKRVRMVINPVGISSAGACTARSRICRATALDVAQAKCQAQVRWRTPLTDPSQPQAEVEPDADQLSVAAPRQTSHQRRAS
jgi:hypothetical protein